jgi:hypothetical protein
MEEQVLVQQALSFVDVHSSEWGNGKKAARLGGRAAAVVA